MTSTCSPPPVRWRSGRCSCATRPAATRRTSSSDVGQEPSDRGGRSRRGRVLERRPELHQDSGGWFVAPAVIDNVSPAMAVAREEIFGPVVAVPAFDTDEEALSARREPTTPIAGRPPPSGPAASTGPSRRPAVSGPVPSRSMDLTPSTHPHCRVQTGIQTSKARSQG
ncbi:aldehyde dehydrogenase family protein [Streptomyces phaeochromogenes]|uniref:aldehyde dehydrogenase family protein n=1 Tax=Streptomyces phaeochromogenes TaxID=1923 RepID=UPI0033C94826